MLTRFWIKFEERGEYPYYGGVFGFGVGVTAYSLADAKTLLETKIFKGALPEISDIHEGVNYDELEANHVKPNMGIMVNRGIWFPLGFD